MALAEAKVRRVLDRAQAVGLSIEELELLRFTLAVRIIVKYLRERHSP